MPLTNDIGQIKNGEFKRGQGGIFDKVERPFDSKIAHDLFVQYEKNKLKILNGKSESFSLVNKDR